ncbi:MAG TPA: HAMP domain-containing sensor histidine kinase [Polyangiaceae bacterium LLY-WYZ-14_1]|nr:HAMP domain-containing sensor histidine kinase [Polyangiaceae bacterium LLY-WYZ-14_1]
MSEDQVGSLSAALGGHLRQRADAIVEEWIDWLLARVGTRTVRSVPRAALRNHIPPVLCSIADYMRAPIEAVRSEMLGHLDLHARLRRDQGYELAELLAEFDGLATIVTRELQERSREEQVPTAALFEVFNRLATGLRAVGFVTVGIYEEAAGDQRRELSSRLEEFANTIAHEIRTPVGTIAMGLDMLAQEEVATDPEQRAHYVEVMGRSLQRTQDLLDDIRQLARLEGVRAVDARQESAPRLVAQVLEELAPMSARGAGVTLEVLGQIPAVEVDSLAFQMALLNLVSNAIKYADPKRDAPRVEISARLVSREDTQDALEVEVRDNGLGIAPEYVGRVFQRHIRAHPETAEGTGLGLAITRQVLWERNGRIDLTSTVGVGTRVVFALPVQGALSDGERSVPTDAVLGQAVRAHLTRKGPVD